MLRNLQGIRWLVLTKSSKFIQSRVISVRSATKTLTSKCCQRNLTGMTALRPPLDKTCHVSRRHMHRDKDLSGNFTLMSTIHFAIKLNYRRISERNGLECRAENQIFRHFLKYEVQRARPILSAPASERDVG